MPKWTSFSSQLTARLELIESDGLALLERSRIRTFRNDPHSDLVIIGPPHSFDALDVEGTRLQMSVLTAFKNWEELYVLLERRIPPGPQRESASTRQLITTWLERTGERWTVPATIHEAKDRFREHVDRLRAVLSFVTGTSEPRVIAVPDTNALTDEPDVSKYREALGCNSFDVVLLPTILGELDELKVRARPEYLPRVQGAIRRLKGWEAQGDWLVGVKVDGSITVRAVAREPCFKDSVSWLDPDNQDDRFLAGVLELQRNQPAACVVVISADLNLRNKAAALSLPRVAPRNDP